MSPHVQGIRRRPAPPPIYAIADADALAPRPVPEAVAEFAGAGIRWIQIRAKRLPDDALARLVEDSVAAAGTAQIWIDDRADLAALFPVAGVHLGQRDLPPSAARRIVGPAVWIGQSTHSDSELARAVSDPDVDLVAVGPIFPTTGKERPDPVVGLGLIRRARAATSLPLVAIGGIDAGNAAEVLAAGADAVAVLGALCRGDVAANAAKLLAAVAG